MRNLNADKDAYGQELVDYLKGKPSYEIVERDDGYVNISGGADNYFGQYKNWPEWQKRGIKFVKGRVLDIGAGAGRVSLYLQKKGHTVTAIDSSPLAIRVCIERGIKDARVLPIEKIDTFKSGLFDTIVMYGNNFGLFSNFKKAKKLLKELYRITTPRALIITESNDPYDTDDPIHLAYHRLNRKRGRMSGQLKLRVRFKNYISNWFDYLLVSRKEMKEVIRGTGWRVKKFIDSNSHMYIAVLSKE